MMCNRWMCTLMLGGSGRFRSGMWVEGVRVGQRCLVGWFVVGVLGLVGGWCICHYQIDEFTHILLNPNSRHLSCRSVLWYVLRNSLAGNCIDGLGWCGYKLFSAMSTKITESHWLCACAENGFGFQGEF